MEKDARDLRTLADIMDQRFRGPFGWRFGFDGLLGLIPVVGDMITNSVSIYIVVRAAQLGCPPSVVARMGWNLLVENVIDIIPFVGNLFDFVWKANTKNLKLVDAYLANPRKVTVSSRAVVSMIVAGIFVVVLSSILLAVWALTMLVNYLERGV